MLDSNTGKVRWKLGKMSRKIGKVSWKLGKVYWKFGKVYSRGQTKSTNFGRDEKKFFVTQTRCGNDRGH